MATRQNTDYGFDIQKLYLEMMMTDGGTFVRCQTIFDPTLFDRKLQPVAEFINNYVIDHNTMPTFEMVNAATHFKLENPGNLLEEHYDWLLMEFETFVRHKGLEKAMLKGMDMLEEGNYGPVFDMVKEAIEVGLTKDIGTDYWASPKDRLMALKDRNGQVKTGWPSLDAKLYGGMNKGELNIFAGASGCVTGDTLVEIKAKNTIHKVRIDSLMGVNEKANVLVSSPDGWVPVIDCVEKIKDICYSTTFDNGKTIISSHDHLYQKHDNEWVYSRDIQVNDIFISDSVTSKVLSHTLLENNPTRVYDLSVDHDNHRYYTDGICSHNTGKSVFLANIGVNWTLAGLNVMYLTFELSENLVAMRIDSMTTGVPGREIFKDLDSVDLKVKLVGKKAGAMQVKYMASGKNANDIKSYLKEYEVKTGKKVDVLLVDYMDLMSPINKRINVSDMFTKDKYVAEELRNLAMEKQCVLVSASQLNRNSIDEVEFDHSHIAGGISKINTADNVLGIFTNKAMRERGEYELQLLKTRNSSGVGQKIKLDFNIDTLRITDPETDDGITAPKVSILDTLKRKGLTADKPDDILGNGASVPKVKVQTDSTRLRQFLNDLPSDEP